MCQIQRQFDINILQICPAHLSDVATLPWEIQKSHFSTLLFIYFRLLFTLVQKKTNSNCCTAASAVYLLLFNASYYLHSPSTASQARYRRSACIDMDMLRLAAVACCDMGWISAQRCVLCDWSVSEKGLVALNTCCDIACLTFQLLHITTASFQSHRRQPTTGSLQSLQRSKERNKPSVRWKSFTIHKLVWWHFTWGEQVDYSLFSSEIT